MMDKEVNSAEFLEKGRKKAKYFTRNRKLPFAKLCLFLLRIVHECLTVAFRRFTEKIGEEITMREQSLSEARNKISIDWHELHMNYVHVRYMWEAFADLSEKVSKFAYTGDYDRWNGYRIWGIDGTKFALPNYPELAIEFGDEKGSPTARGSILYDLVNYTVLDGQIEKLEVDERTLAKRHLSALVERLEVSKDLVISDRGYPSEEMIDFYEKNNLYYLMRVRSKFNVEVDNIPMGGGYVHIGQHKVRVVKVVLDTGEIEILLTNLTEDFDFKELYFMRWGVEIRYDVFKTIEQDAQNHG